MAQGTPVGSGRRLLAQGALLYLGDASWLREGVPLGSERRLLAYGARLLAHGGGLSTQRGHLSTNAMPLGSGVPFGLGGAFSFREVSLGSEGASCLRGRRLLVQGGISRLRERLLAQWAPLRPKGASRLRGWLRMRVWADKGPSLWRPPPLDARLTAECLLFVSRDMVQ